MLQFSSVYVIFFSNRIQWLRKSIQLESFLFSMPRVISCWGKCKSHLYLSTKTSKIWKYQYIVWLMKLCSIIFFFIVAVLTMVWTKLVLAHILTKYNHNFEYATFTLWKKIEFPDSLLILLKVTFHWKWIDLQNCYSCWILKQCHDNVFQCANSRVVWFH